MTPDDVRFLVQIAGSAGMGALIASGIALLLVRHFLGSYMVEKGKNLATKEDIADITHKIEGIKSQYALEAERFKAEHQLRLAAVDRRLLAHQEAFALWRRIVRSFDQETGWEEVHNACQKWWDSNCLFLEPRARDAFSCAIVSTNILRDVDLRRRGEDGTDQAMSLFEAVAGAGDEIAKAVALPGLAPAEQHELQESISHSIRRYPH